MSTGIKFFKRFCMILLLAGCVGPARFDFAAPVTAFYTHVKIPVSTKIFDKEMSEKSAKHYPYKTSFLWIPFVVPPLAVSSFEDDFLKDLFFIF